jgi:hypothetical protein
MAVVMLVHVLVAMMVAPILVLTWMQLLVSMTHH